MKARSRLENPYGLSSFDLNAEIIPEQGAGGVTFKNVIADFEYAITNDILDNGAQSAIKHQLDSKYFYLTLQSQEDEFRLEIDLFSGKIDSMICRQGYKGKLANGFGIGSKMIALIQADPSIGFDLDHSFFTRSPFDGLIIYAPWALVDPIYDATVSGAPMPDFTIETLEIISLDFAKAQFEGTLVWE